MCCLCLFALLAVVMLCLAFGVVAVVGVVVVVDGVVVYSVCCLCRLFSLLLFGF